MPLDPRLRLHREPPPYAEAVREPGLVACPGCDLLQRLPRLEPGASARCLRCDTELWRRRVDSLRRSFALAVAAAILYLIANTSPMLGLDAAGHEASTTVVGGAARLWRDDQRIVAALVLFTAVVAPALQIAFMLTITLAARRPRPGAWVGVLLRHHPTTRTWSMIEVMMIGVLVALIKIAELATVVPGTGLYALAALIVLLPAMQSSFDAREVWERIEWVEERERARAAAPSDALSETPA